MQVETSDHKGTIVVSSRLKRVGEHDIVAAFAKAAGYNSIGLFIRDVLMEKVNGTQPA